MAVKCRFIQGSFSRSFHPDVRPTVSKRSGLQLLKWEVRRSLEQGFSPPNLESSAWSQISNRVELFQGKDSCLKAQQGIGSWGRNWRVLRGKLGKLAPQNSGQVFQTFGPAARLHQSIAVRTNQPKWCNAFLLKTRETCESRWIISLKNHISPHIKKILFVNCPTPLDPKVVLFAMFGDVLSYYVLSHRYNFFTQNEVELCGRKVHTPVAQSVWSGAERSKRFRTILFRIWQWRQGLGHRLESTQSGSERKTKTRKEQH